MGLESERTDDLKESKAPRNRKVIRYEGSFESKAPRSRKVVRLEGLTTSKGKKSRRFNILQDKSK